MRTLNLGILAHVDAGKTSLTERLLFDVGAINTLGRVDGGNTQTDSLELERQRGITIAAAVVSFTLTDLVVNLIDTPGHPDFIAEVERVLALLDAAVVVVSAVEGVQAQTRVLVRALKRLGIPFLFFVNKVDRLGARYGEVLDQIASQLQVQPLAMVEVAEVGSRGAGATALALTEEPLFSALCERLAQNDETLLADYILAPERLDAGRLEAALAAQVAEGQVHPAYGGIAMTGLGLAELIGALKTLLPGRVPDADAALAGAIFKIERGWGGEKIAYLDVKAGALALRDHVELPRGGGKVTSLQVFGDGHLHKASQVGAGHIAKVGGLTDARIGDVIGTDRTGRREFHFAPPTLETRVLPARPSEGAALWLALQQLSEQDPLINLRTNEDASDMFVSLYGEVQKEVIAAVLATEFDIDVVFEESTIIHVERLLGTGEAVEVLFKPPNPFLATVGLRIEPRPEGAGNSFALEVDIGQMPIAFYRAVEDAVAEMLRAGLCGWQVIDCHVAMTASRHSSPSSTAADFRNLTPLVLAAALEEAQTIVCEPIDNFGLDVPLAVLAPIQALLARSGAAMRSTSIKGGMARLEGVLALAAIPAIQRHLPGLTSGAGVLEHGFDHYAPVTHGQPMRARMGANPFDRADYLRQIR